MTALLVSIADAITACLNTHDFGVEFTAERSYADWDELLEDLDTLHVDVVPIGYPVAELGDRGHMHYTPAIHVGVRKHFGVDDQQTSNGRIKREEIDRLVLLVEDMNERFAKATPDDGLQATWKGGKIDVTFDRKMLRDNRQFLGIIRFTFDAYKDLA